MPSRKLLIYFAHPEPEVSRANAFLARRAKALEGVDLVDLYAQYPRFDVDVEREQARLAAHDVIIFMHPLYWYSTPALLKEWQDQVLERGFAYGPGGNALHGKLFFCAVTAGGLEGAHGGAGASRYTLREMLRPLERLCAHCGMIYLPPLALFRAGAAVETDDLPRHADELILALEALRDGRFDIEALEGVSTMNARLKSAMTRAPDAPERARLQALRERAVKEKVLPSLKEQ